MKRAFLVLSLVFAALTAAGAVYVFLNRAEANAGYAVIPMLVCSVFLAAYRAKK